MSGEVTEQLTPQQEIDAGLLAALPMLAAMRGPGNQLQEIEFRVGPDSELPKEPVLLRAYGNSMQDPDVAGVWKFAQQGYPSIYIWSREFGVTLHDRINRERRLPEGEVEPSRALECARLLVDAQRQFELQQQVAASIEDVTPDERRRRGLGLLSLLRLFARRPG